MLSIDAGKMHKVDTRNVENLFGMWTGEWSLHSWSKTESSLMSGLARATVFSKCAESMEDGKRLENLSWRLWNRETLCCEAQPHCATTPALDIAPARPDRGDLPELSASVESVASDGAGSAHGDQLARTAPVDIVPPAASDGLRGRSRGREKHITSLGLEKMVFSIKEKQRLEPLSPRIVDAVPIIVPTADVTPRPKSPSIRVPPPRPSSDSLTSTAPLTGSDSEHSPMNAIESDTSAELTHSHSVVRGFSPNLISNSYRSHSHLAPSSIPTRHAATPLGKTGGEPKKGDMFLLGGSSDDGSSLEDRLFHQPRQSSLTAGLRRPLAAKKQTSFRDEVESRTINHKLRADEDVFESDDEIDASESAIDDDDEDEDGSEWEDSTSDSGEGANDKHLFQRVDSRPHLVSRRSLLTTLIHQGDRAAAFANKASRSSPALRRLDIAPSSDSSASSSLDDESTLTMPSRSKMTGSRPIIMAAPNLHPPALSPRTTRRNMLATELTESLRKHLLWERQQKSTTANAVLRRRHTAFDVSNLQEYPGQKPDLFLDGSKNNGWNHFFDTGSGEYHQAGW